MRTLQYLSILFLAALMGGCDSTNSIDRVCTAEFRIFSTTVLSPDGEPADSVDISITIGDSDESFDPCAEDFEENCDIGGPVGFYIIFHDGLIDKIDEGENATVLVEGTRGELGFTREFVFTNDGCHVAKVAGPDTVTLQSN